MWCQSDHEGRTVFVYKLVPEAWIFYGVVACRDAINKCREPSFVKALCCIMHILTLTVTFICNMHGFPPLHIQYIQYIHKYANCTHIHLQTYNIYPYIYCISINIYPYTVYYLFYIYFQSWGCDIATTYILKLLWHPKIRNLLAPVRQKGVWAQSLATVCVWP